MQIPRTRQRTKVDITVIVTTVLDSLEGTIVDLSEGGAQIAGCALPVRSQCQIDFEGHVVFGTVQWAEPDRMGIRFPDELADGPLFDRLEAARGGGWTPPTFQSRSVSVTGGFGRRHS